MSRPSPALLTPSYWAAACQALSHADPILGRIISKNGSTALVLRGDLLTTCARAIVGQQISVKAAANVWSRVTSRFGPLHAETLSQASPSDFDGLGLSGRKIDYLRDLAAHFARSPALADDLTLLDDESVIARLTEIRGIGRWTAEMALIFALGRPDVLPLADLGLMKAVRLHYRHGKPITPLAAQRLAKRWQPWRSVATWHLWRSLDPEPVEY